MARSNSSITGIQLACGVALLLVLAEFTLTSARRDDAGQCAPSRLIAADMESLGVQHIQLMGKLDGGKEIFMLSGFVRLKKTGSRLQLFGLAWLAYTDHMAGYQPELRDIQEMRMRNMSLVGMNTDWTEAGFQVPLNATHTWNKKEHVKNFRMDVDVHLPPKYQHLHYFQIHVHGWDHYFPLDVHRRTAHGLILPWHAMPSPSPASGGASARTLALDSHRHKRTKSTLAADEETAASASHAKGSSGGSSGGGSGGSTPGPLVVAVALSNGASHDLDTDRMVHQAQALIRHAEYHLGQLKMQRMFVYVYPFIFNSLAFHEYLSRHMPPELVPYVTFVMWTQLPVNSYAPIWQLAMYYHAAVALWGYGGVRIANIDLDEYIAFPGPQTTLQQALERCDAGDKDVVELVNEFLTCPQCQARYGDDNHADTDFWSRVETPLAKSLWKPRPTQQQGGGGGGEEGAEAVGESWRCRWYNQDPLRMYSLRWNDKWFEQQHWKRSDRLKDEVVNLNRGKVILQPEGVIAFNWHHADAKDHTRQVILDPTASCPYVAHMLHLFGSRESRHGGAKELYKDPAVPVDWWLMDQGKP